MFLNFCGNPVSVATLWMEKFQGEQKNVTRSATFYLFLFYQYNFVEGLLQGFMINTHELGSNSPGAGTFSSDLTKTKTQKSLH